MHNQGLREDFVTDQILKQAARDGGIRPKRDLSSIDDGALARGLSNPALVDL
jgi:hypothetical protein